MKKSEILTRLNVNDAELASILGITRAAVAQWGSEEPIPAARWFSLKYKFRPEVFRNDPDPVYIDPRKDQPKKDREEEAA